MIHKRLHFKFTAFLLVFLLCMSMAFAGCAKKEAVKISLLTADTSGAKLYAEALQDMWHQNLGIEVTVNSLPFASMMQKMMNKDYQMVLIPFGPDYNDPMTFLDMFVTDGGNNVASYSNPEYDGLISKAKVEPDTAKRMGYLKEAEEILMKDIPLAPIYFNKVDWIKTDGLEGVVRSALGGDPDFYTAEIPGGELTWNMMAEPPTLDPQLANDSVSLQVINSIMEGLYRIGEDGKPVPGMAESYTLSDDKKTYTFTIREDAKWSNGDPVTAEDFLFGIQRALDPETASYYAYILYDIKGAAAVNSGEAGMEELGVSVDGNKLIITLDNPVPYFLEITAFGTIFPCNKKFYESLEAGKYGADTEAILCNGPWEISSWEHESKLILEKNENYWNEDAIKINKIEGLMISEASTYMNMFYNKELDMINLPGDKRQEAIDKGYEINSFSDGTAQLLIFNMVDPWTANADIRKALSMALDREAFCKNVLKNSSIPAYGLVSPDIPGAADKFRTEAGDLLDKFDTEAAKEHLAVGEKEVRKNLK